MHRENIIDVIMYDDVLITDICFLFGMMSVIRSTVSSTILSIFLFEL